MFIKSTQWVLNEVRMPPSNVDRVEPSTDVFGIVAEGHTTTCSIEGAGHNIGPSPLYL